MHSCNSLLKHLTSVKVKRSFYQQCFTCITYSITVIRVAKVSSVLPSLKREKRGGCSLCNVLPRRPSWPQSPTPGPGRQPAEWGQDSSRQPQLTLRPSLAMCARRRAIPRHLGPGGCTNQSVVKVREHPHTLRVLLANLMDQGIMQHFVQALSLRVSCKWSRPGHVPQWSWPSSACRGAKQQDQLCRGHLETRDSRGALYV